jgi:uncharacterized Zn-binding protein involved in type VI secretion
MASKAIIKEGDQISHSGKVVGGSTSGRSGGQAIARVGDPVYCEKHGMQKIVSGSSKVRLGGKPVALGGDLVSCGALLLPNPQEKSGAAS